MFTTPHPEMHAMLPADCYALWYDHAGHGAGWCRDMTGTAAECIAAAERLFGSGSAADFALLPPGAGPDAIGRPGSHVLFIEPGGPRLDPPLPTPKRRLRGGLSAARR